MKTILIGGDKTVYFLARQFIERGYQVVIIHKDRARCLEMAHSLNATIIQGEGSGIKQLEEAGAREADVVMALTDHDQDNLIACQIAHKLYGVPRTLALVNDPENEPLFMQLGVTAAFSATKVIASLIEQQAHFDDITSLMPIAEGRLNVTDVRLDANSPAIGKSLADLSMSGGSLVAAIIRDNDMIIPRGATRLLVDDHLILISHPESQEKDLVVLCGEAI
ncbi:MAG: potassium channel family protein [Phototrophicaceae bacterium]